MQTFAMSDLGVFLGVLGGIPDAHLPFPPAGEVCVAAASTTPTSASSPPGKQSRVPGFLATSFARATATRFLRTAEAYGQQAVLWVVRVDPAGEDDQTQRCKHVNFVTHSLVGGEAEYLFTAYSIFTVRAVEWGVGGAAHRIEIDAATDNRVEAEGGDGGWATPVGSEGLPLAPWF